jgi:glycosyltransferase involved in cell wall biosynthesis
LNRRGHNAVIVHAKRGFKIGWHEYDVPVIWTDDNPKFRSDDVLVFPEAMIALAKQVGRNGCRRVVIPLNWSYIYRVLPHGENWNDYGITNVITPSAEIKAFVEWSMGIATTVIPEYVDTRRYHYQPERKRNKIAFMPRKSSVGDELRSLLSSRSNGLAGGYEWTRLLDLSELKYAEQLKESRIYLATTSQEGTNISVLEAMCAGCVVIGFSGIGGRDYMRGEGPARNCILVENEDMLGLGQSLEMAILQQSKDPRHFDLMIANAIATAAAYGDLDAEARCLESYFSTLT